MDSATGMPRRWRQFVIGLQVMGRTHAKEAIRMASAAQTVKMEERDRKQWYRDQKQEAGWI